MHVKSRKLYWLLTMLTFLGYLWVYVNIELLPRSQDLLHCPIKWISGFPCPACGSSRAVILLLKGEWWTSIMLNPLGILIGLFLLIAPVWIAYDVLFRSYTLWECYIKIEENLKKRWFAIPLLAILAINWIWNISKGI